MQRHSQQVKQRSYAVNKPTALIVNVPKSEVPLSDPAQLHSVASSGDTNWNILMADTKLASASNDLAHREGYFLQRELLPR